MGRRGGVVGPLETAVDKMPDQATTGQIYYNATYRHGVDEKRRVQIPAKWRPYESGVEFTLIFWPKAKEGPCLRVLPPKEMAQLMDSIDAMPNSDPNKTVLKRFIGSESVQVALDKSGRVCLPEEMAKAAGIEDDAILVGLLDRFEIWDPDRYAKVKASDAIMAQEAFKLME
jgi:MraZ protein